MVTISDEEGRKRDITNKSEIEFNIMNSNRMKYHQTETTCPFFKEPLLSHFGICGDGPAIQSFMDGSYKVPVGVDEYMADFISVCRGSNV